MKIYHDNFIAPADPWSSDAWRVRDGVEPHDYTLQSLIWPDREVNTERELFFRLKGNVGISIRNRQFVFATGGEARFDTWFNLFNIAKWVRKCGLKQLSLRLEGRGRFELVILQARPGRSEKKCVNEIFDLDESQPLDVDISEVLDPHGGAVFFTLKALSDGFLSGAGWITTDRPRRNPRMMVSITTFRRPEAIARSVRRIEEFLSRSDLNGHLRAQVIDNGQDCGLTSSQMLDVHPNANLGGAGGFTRGLIEARRRGATHCLFMDDDASLHVESFERSWIFLAYALDERTAIAGAMIDEAHKWAIWENGAIFDQGCQPQFMGTDLRAANQMLEMEARTALPAPDKLYGGWWFFAFPLQQVRHLPFPFFVRGDDVSFSLANDFDIVRLSGVASYQGNFAEKDSPLTFYLDLRSHLAHHLSLPRMEVGRLALAKLCLRFAARCILRLHYDSLDAVNIAISDTIKGPDFFTGHADAAEQRAAMKALTRTETWQEMHGNLPRDRIVLDPNKPLPRLLAKLTGNGMIVPGFRWLGNRRVLSSELRGAIRPIWGAASLTYVDEKNDRLMYLVHDKKRAVLGLWGTCRQIWRLSWQYDELRARWRESYDEVTLSQAYWDRALSLPAAE